MTDVVDIVLTPEMYDIDQAFEYVYDIVFDPADPFLSAVYNIYLPPRFFVDLSVNAEVVDITVAADVDQLLMSQDVIVDITLEGPPGPQGEQGLPGDITFEVISAGPIGADRLVVPDGGAVVYADSSDLTQVGRSVWLTLTSVSAAAEALLVRPIGVHTEPTWRWSVDTPVFVGRNGLLTQVPPSAAAGDKWSCEVGTALSETSIFFDPETPIQLVEV